MSIDKGTLVNGAAIGAGLLPGKLGPVGDVASIGLGAWGAEINAGKEIAALATELGVDPKTLAIRSTIIHDWLKERENASVNSVVDTAPGLAGGLAGGAAAGAALGSIIPGAGTALGAIAGGAVGVAGSIMGSFATNAVVGAVKGEPALDAVAMALQLKQQQHAFLGGDTQSVPPISKNQVFSLLLARSPDKQKPIAETMEKLTGTRNLNQALKNPKFDSVRRRHDSVFLAVAKDALGEKFDPKRNAVEQLTDAMNNGYLNPAHLLLDDSRLATRFPTQSTQIAMKPSVSGVSADANGYFNSINPGSGRSA